MNHLPGQNSPMADLRIHNLRRDAGLTLEDLAERAGLSPGYLSRIANGKRDGNARALQKIAEALEVSVSDLYPLKGEIRLPETKIDLPVAMQNDLAIMGTAAGSDTAAMQIDTSGPIAMTWRPPGLATAKDVYAIYVVGTSMEPRFDDGELLYVSGKRPAKPGDDVVVQMVDSEDGTVSAYLKRLVAITDDTIRLKQFNPENIFEVPRSHARAIHRVYRSIELITG